MSRFTFKIVLIGDQAVGKTSLVLRYINDTFSEHYISTIGADFLIKDLHLMGAPVRLMIWDLGGQEQWEGIRARYMQGSDGVILIFDVSRKQDLEYYISNWIKEVKDFIGEKVPIVIVGNKMDLKPQISLKYAENYVKSLNYHYVETSAKLGTHVEEMFQRIASEIVLTKAEYVKRLKGIQDTDISDIFSKMRREK